MSPAISSWDIIAYLRWVDVDHLKKLPGLYPHDGRALPLIHAEITRRPRRAGGITTTSTTTR